ncbi:GNAT family N-acetyltransferase [Clostridium sp. AN503]|uniref:GNAT family N-acetyltransferase n=1 Tax=Clostridium sp. AN503 TaxID=3160598 RepID=UPI003458B4D0
MHRGGTGGYSRSAFSGKPCGSAWGYDPEAFWGLKRDGDGWELEYFYVAEAALGKGLGRQMWDHLNAWCRENQVSAFHFVTSPQAVGFYEKMGAVQDGVTRSSIDGRLIPHFRSIVPMMGN